MPAPDLMLQDIFAQPALIEASLRDGRGSVQKLANAIRQRNINLVIIAARGTSDHAALYAKYLFEINLGIPVSLAAPSVYTLYESTPCPPDALVLGISQSGQGADIVEVLRQSRRAGALTACITNNEDSLITQHSDHVLLCNAGEEIAVAATKTYTTSLAMIALLTDALMMDIAFSVRLSKVPEEIATALEVHGTIRDVVAEFKSMQACVVLARGINHATGFETALKLTETCHVGAKAWSGADFQHGPIGMVDAAFPSILFAPLGKAFESMRALAQNIKDREGPTLIFSPSNDILSLASVPVQTAEVMDERLSPISAIVAGQLFAYELAICKGLNPDRPKGLTKVTSTL